MKRRGKTSIFIPWSYCILMGSVVGVLWVGTRSWVVVALFELCSLARTAFDSIPILLVRPDQIWVISGFKCQKAARSEIRTINYRYSPEDIWVFSFLYIVRNDGEVLDATFRFSASENIAAAMYLEKWLEDGSESGTVPSPGDVAGHGLLLPAGILPPGYRWYPLIAYTLFLSVPVVLFILRAKLII